MVEFDKNEFPFTRENEDEIGIGRRIRRKKPAVTLGGIFFVILTVVLVIGSFWVSFYFGKRILTPKKNIPNINEFEARLEEQKNEASKFITGPVSAKTKVEKITEVKPVKKATVKKDIFFPAKKTRAHVQKKITKKVVVKPKIAVAPKVKKAPAVVEEKLYKVQVVIVKDKDTAVKEMKKLDAEGFEVLANEIDGGKFSVQAGAFKNKDNALKVIKELEAKGFSGKIIIE